MKILGLAILILCIHLSQVCSFRELSDEDVIEIVNGYRDKLYGVSEQFFDDVKVIYDKFRNNFLILNNILNGVLLINNVPEAVVKRKNVKIDKQMMKDYYSSDSFIKFQLDILKITQSILSKQMPSERYQGIMNVLYVCCYRNATTGEIESALGYLYGTDTAVPKTSFLDKIPYLESTDCPSERDTYSLPEAEHSIKTMKGIKPNVLHDFIAIRNKFPCTGQVLDKLRLFAKFLERSQGKDSKLDACKIKANPGKWGEHWPSPINSRENMKTQIQDLESTLSTRLTDEAYDGIISFLKVTIPDTPIDEIEKALEYLYDYVPKAKCPDKEGSKLKTE